MAQQTKRNFIEGAIKRPGALRKKAGVKPGKNIPVKKLNQLAKSDNPLTRKQANFAKTLRKINKRKK